MLFFATAKHFSIQYYSPLYRRHCVAFLLRISPHLLYAIRHGFYYFMHR